MATADSGNLHLGSTPRISIESYLFENVRFFFSGYQPSEPATASSAGSSETVRSCWNSFAAANATCRRSVGWIWSTSPPAYSPAAPVKTRLHFILMTRNKNKQLKPLARKQFRWRRREERPRHRTSRVFRAIKTKIELDSTTNVPTHHHLLIFRSPRPTSHVWPKEKYTRLPPCRWNTNRNGVERLPSISISIHWKQKLIKELDEYECFKGIFYVFHHGTRWLGRGEPIPIVAKDQTGHTQGYHQRSRMGY